MAGRLSKIINLVNNMGWRYTSFRLGYELRRRAGSLKRRFPVHPAAEEYITLEEWKAQPGQFFFDSGATLDFPHNPRPELKETFDNIKKGTIWLFNSLPAELGTDYDWITNPDTGFRYDINKHWTEIPDLSREAGDIKFVWEKSRFSYLYDIIRYDYHFQEDCSALVFGDILSWIAGNPVNCGPNYRCSQEMSLRVLNWTFALHYYKNSPALTPGVFSKIQYAIYWHMHHVYENIDFSRIAVRNNHAITETLVLYLAGMLYPAMPGAAKWKTRGKAWFETEVAYQVYEDGTYLQFSMNYHRVVVQLMTWAIALSEKNGERFAPVVYDRAKRSVEYLRTCMVDENGWLPNYGANDGALFFKLGSSHFRDYRPQLQALAVALGMDLGFGDLSEDVKWYGLKSDQLAHWEPDNGTHSFDKGGYYLIREPGTLTFIKCGGYKDRPSHADNLHLDIWYKGENILPDAGSYKYNTDEQTIRYFSGTASHNTVMLGDNDQMLKGGRFIWYYWPQRKNGSLEANAASYVFEGTVAVYRYIKQGISHKRRVVKQKGIPVWEVRDEIEGSPDGLQLKQLWHMPLVSEGIEITARDSKGVVLPPQVSDGWYSSLYGQKEKTMELCFTTEEEILQTIIKVGQST